jgi:two-component system phosphate regulon response regulator PhoB
MHRPHTLLIPSERTGLIVDLARTRPDLTVLPLELPVQLAELEQPAWAFVEWIGAEMSGLELCRQLRESRAGRDLHITIVLDQGDSEERRRALKAGADDYIAGPLDLDALIRRLDQYQGANGKGAPPRARLANGELSIDLAAHQLRYRGHPVPLRPNEFRLLAHFMEHPDQVFSRTALIERLGKDEEAIDERTVDVWVGRLRRALAAHSAPDPLRTVRALGYVMDSADS